LVNQLLNIEYQFLRTSYAESRDQNNTTVLQCVIDNGVQALSSSGNVFMLFVAVCGLYEQIVGTLWRLGIG
ncbi:hypothetical protein OFN71_39815, partial [Escherichia coli]|nr:hypothetical protein [Escherichia coli]